jgi:hypothetical protein
MIAVMTRHLYLYRRTPARLMDLVYWPFLDLIVWGFMAVYLVRVLGLTFADEALNVRLSTFGATAFIDRVPVSEGTCRRLGRARNAWCRISRSIRCRPHEIPSANRSCQTRRAP